ncbi:hypothetical protein ACEPAG_1130 [Sanghuangporus baumii]
MGRKVAIKASKMNSTADLNDDTNPSNNTNTNTNTNTNFSKNTCANTNTSNHTNTNINTDANTNTNNSTNTSTNTSTNYKSIIKTNPEPTPAPTPPPLSRSYPRSAASSEPNIRAHGITHLLSIGVSPPGPALPGVVHTHVPMLDGPSARIDDESERAREAIEAVHPPADRDDAESESRMRGKGKAEAQSEPKTKGEGGEDPGALLDSRLALANHSRRVADFAAQHVSQRQSGAHRPHTARCESGSGAVRTVEGEGDGDYGVFVVGGRGELAWEEGGEDHRWTTLKWKSRSYIPLDFVIDTVIPVKASKGEEILDSIPYR